MKNYILIAATLLFLVSSCTTTNKPTGEENKIVGTSPKFTGKKKLTAGAIAEGKTVFENSCAKCHDLPTPSKYSDEKWIGLINAMAPKAKLNKKQTELVYDYVTFKN